MLKTRQKNCRNPIKTALAEQLLRVPGRFSSLSQLPHARSGSSCDGSEGQPVAKRPRQHRELRALELGLMGLLGGECRAI